MELLARGHFLGTLDEYAADTAAGSGRLVLLSGEAGIGKTSLVEVPVYAGRLAWSAPAGALQVLVTAGRWVTDAEGAPLRLAT